MFFSATIKYLRYIVLSHHKNGHGIHSPFIFDVVARIFRNRIDPEIVFKIERLRRNMLADKRTIVVKDLGFNRSDKSDTRRIADIAKRSPVNRKYGRLLYNMAAEFGKPLIIELGTSFGISAMYMGAANKETEIYTIEGSSEIAGIARQNFIDGGFDNIRLSEGAFDDILPELIKSVKSPGLVFIDGNHRKEPVIKYFNMLADISDSKTVIIVDDINYSQEMSEAWCKLKSHKKVTVSIDIFRMGILFFREGINANNYVIRY